jgi:hypothetical protein
MMYTSSNSVNIDKVLPATRDTQFEQSKLSLRLTKPSGVVSVYVCDYLLNSVGPVYTMVNNELQVTPGSTGFIRFSGVPTAELGRYKFTITAESIASQDTDGVVVKDMYIGSFTRVEASTTINV